MKLYNVFRSGTPIWSFPPCRARGANRCGLMPCPIGTEAPQAFT